MSAIRYKTKHKCANVPQVRRLHARGLGQGEGRRRALGGAVGLALAPGLQSLDGNLRGARGRGGHALGDVAVSLARLDDVLHPHVGGPAPPKADLLRREARFPHRAATADTEGVRGRLVPVSRVRNDVFRVTVDERARQNFAPAAGILQRE